MKFIKSLNINKSNIPWAIASDVFDVNKYWFSLIKHKNVIILIILGQKQQQLD